MALIRNCILPVISASKSYHRVLSESLRNRCNIRLHTTGSYEGDGKTHATILNDEGLGLMINGYSEVGFSLNNGVTVLGPMAIFPNCVLSWNVGGLADISEESLKLFLMLDPKLDILILGVPEYNKTDRAVLTSLAKLIRKHKIQVEVMPTEVACPTFNFLHAEQRFVAAGIIPPLRIDDKFSQAMSGADTVGYVHRDDFK